MTPTTARLFYLIATYGKNFAPKIKLCPAVSTQIANLQYFYPQDATVRYIFVGDYARNIDGLDDLPVLKSTLKKVSLQERGLLVIDDISRLFRPCTLPNRPNLLSELEPFGDRLVSRRENAKLSDFTDSQKRLIVRDAEKRTNWHVKGARDLGTREERADATEGARIASEVSRKSAAVQRQAQILELEVEMMTAGLPHTTADVAREANERDLRTAQGLHWSARSVRDAVREAKSYATR